MNQIYLIGLTDDIDIVLHFIKILFINICSLYTFIKINNKSNIKWLYIFWISIGTILVSLLCTVVKYKIDYLSSILCMVLLLGMLYAIINKGEIIYNIVSIIICLGINFAIFFCTIIISFIPNIIFGLQNDLYNLIIMMIIHTTILFGLFKMKKLKNGFPFLEKSYRNDYYNILILNISIIIMFSFIIAKNVNNILGNNLVFGVIILSMVICISIKETFTMYYKHKLLVSDLEETKAELESKKKEIEKLEAENLEFSKTSHTISHQLKSLKFKVKELEMNKEIANEIDISNRVQELSSEYYKKTAIANIDKTGITEIDDMLKYMQAECINNDIEFELQLNGSIHYMVNNIIPKEKLEILLADHIKDAIIAVRHSNNINRSILVRLGMIDGSYSIFIYDSGIEFEKETLLNLGKKPITTHKDDGGTGMGFMNTFDTLNEYNASMIIDEIGIPSEDNYTKVVIIKFDNKHCFNIKSYREITITQ